MADMISLEEAQTLVLDHMKLLPMETVPLLESIGRVAACDQTSDMDVSPFAHSAMDGYAVFAADLQEASEGNPVCLSVLAEVAAGDVFEGAANSGECVRIMTGAPLPEMFDAVVKYEVVRVVSGDGAGGSVVEFVVPTEVGSNIRQAGEEAHAGDVVVSAGEVITSAGAGFLASCGVLEVPVYRRPRVAIIATGSELVDACNVPQAGQIRNSNSYALAACAQAAGAVPEMLPVVRDSLEALENALEDATKRFDFVVTSGGAANGDFDYIKPAVAEKGELFMTTVNMRPGKAQTFGIVNGTPVFGLPGNPAAAYCGFELIIRPALRKMQGFTTFDRATTVAQLASDVKKRDPRRLFMRGSLVKAEDGALSFIPANNQSSGLFGPIQRSNCLAMLPEFETGVFSQGTKVTCVLLDVPEGVVL